MTANEHEQGLFLGEQNALNLDCDDGCSNL